MLFKTGSGYKTGAAMIIMTAILLITKHTKKIINIYISIVLSIDSVHY